MPHRENVGETDVSDKPLWVRALPPTTPEKRANIEEEVREEHRTMMAVDDAIEAIFAKLTDTGELDNTIFVFMTDNGYSHNSHNFHGKLCPYEECVRTPFLVRYPWGGANRTETRLVTNADLASTFTELAGVTPGPQDGRSLVPLRDETAGEWREAVVMGTIGGAGVPEWYGLRTERYKYVELPATGERELYDLSIDPFELNNVAGQPAYESVQSELAASLAYELAREPTVPPRPPPPRPPPPRPRSPRVASRSSR